MEEFQRGSIFFTVRGISSLEVGLNRRMKSLIFEHQTFRSRTLMMNSMLEDWKEQTQKKIFFNRIFIRTIQGRMLSTNKLWDSQQHQTQDQNWCQHSQPKLLTGWNRLSFHLFRQSHHSRKSQTISKLK